MLGQFSCTMHKQNKETKKETERSSSFSSFDSIATKAMERDIQQQPSKKNSQSPFRFFVFILFPVVQQQQ